MINPDALVEIIVYLNRVMYSVIHDEIVNGLAIFLSGVFSLPIKQ